MELRQEVAVLKSHLEKHSHDTKNHVTKLNTDLMQKSSHAMKAVDDLKQSTNFILSQINAALQDEIRDRKNGDMMLTTKVETGSKQVNEELSTLAREADARKDAHLAEIRPLQKQVQDLFNRVELLGRSGFKTAEVAAALKTTPLMTIDQSALA